MEPRPEVTRWAAALWKALGAWEYDERLRHERLEAAAWTLATIEELSGGDPLATCPRPDGQRAGLTGRRLAALGVGAVAGPVAQLEHFVLALTKARAPGHAPDIPEAICCLEVGHRAVTAFRTGQPHAPHLPAQLDAVARRAELAQVYARWLRSWLDAGQPSRRTVIELPAVTLRWEEHFGRTRSGQRLRTRRLRLPARCFEVVLASAAGM